MRSQTTELPSKSIGFIGRLTVCDLDAANNDVACLRSHNGREIT
jgi:hypothetical protein